jgi:hypothetical protein
VLELLWPPGSFVLFNHLRLILFSFSGILCCVSVTRMCETLCIWFFMLSGTVVTEWCMCLCSTDELYCVIIFFKLSYYIIYYFIINIVMCYLFNSKLSADVTCSVISTGYHCHWFECCIL